MNEPKKIDYIEAPSRDLELTKAFFAKLFAWEFVDYGPEYTAFSDGRLNGGFFKSETVASTKSGSALVVFYSAELEAIQAQVIALGGVVCQEIFSFPGGRRFQFIEPGGSEFAIWSDK